MPGIYIELSWNFSFFLVFQTPDLYAQGLLACGRKIRGDGENDDKRRTKKCKVWKQSQRIFSFEWNVICIFTNTESQNYFVLWEKAS